MARPVIATDHDDARAVVHGAGAGWTFPPGDVAALTELIAHVGALPPEELNEVGRRARRHVDEHHTWDHRGRLLVEEMRSRGLL